MKIKNKKSERRKEEEGNGVISKLGLAAAAGTMDHTRRPCSLVQENTGTVRVFGHCKYEFSLDDPFRK